MAEKVAVLVPAARLRRGRLPAPVDTLVEVDDKPVAAGARLRDALLSAQQLARRSPGARRQFLELDSARRRHVDPGLAPGRGIVPLVTQPSPRLFRPLARQFPRE